MSKIFVIGFNKTATRAFHNLFKGSGIASVHWDDGNLAMRIVENETLGQPLLKGYEDMVAFSDIEFVSKKMAIYPHMTHFKKLFHQYPDSYFILNTRDVDSWVSSRKAHAGGLYLRLCMQAQGLNEEELTNKWIDEYHSHHQNVMEFFNEYERFIRLDIEGLDIAQFVDFMSQDYRIDAKKWVHLESHTKTRK